LIRRRLHHEPIAYITGVKEFFGIEFYVDYRVLIPRPETELLVEQALKMANSRFPTSCTIADVGTGCGAIAIALALNLPQAEVYATDISARALEVVAINCHRHKVNGRVHLRRGNLLNPIPKPMNLIVANLPYIRDSDIAKLAAETRLFEPTLALAGGEDGLRWIKELLSQVKSRLCPRGAILLEIAPGQGSEIAALARETFTKARIRVLPDLNGQERVLIIECV
jgi:release factor glutamine methyltransferase